MWNTAKRIKCKIYLPLAIDTTNTAAALGTRKGCGHLPSPPGTGPGSTVQRQALGKLGNRGQCVPFFPRGGKREPRVGMFSSFSIHFLFAYLSPSLDIIVPLQEFKPKYRGVLVLQNKKLNYISICHPSHSLYLKMSTVTLLISADM